MHQGANLREREQDKENDVWGPVGKRTKRERKEGKGYNITFVSHPFPWQCGW